jgi:hypothetical protein
MREADELRDRGYTIIEGYVPAATIDELTSRCEELWNKEGERSGAEFKQEPGSRRLANLVDKGEIFEKVWADPYILGLVGVALGPHFKLSSLNARSANPFSDSSQPLHADMGAIEDSRGFWVCNTVWLLDDFTTDNGALRAVPGSHRYGKLPSPPEPEGVLITAPRGTVVVMNAHMWHGGTANRTDKPRRALHSFYCRSDKPQQQWQSKLLRESTKARMTPELRALLALDDPVNDELCAAGSGQSGFLK